MKYVVCFLMLLGVFSSCSSEDNYEPADNALVATQQFLLGCLKGDFKQADYYLLKDSSNEAQLKGLKDAYYQNSADQRMDYRKANVIIQNDEVLSTTEEVVTYQNSYDKVNRKLKSIKTESGWKVDLKYTFSGNL